MDNAHIYAQNICTHGQRQGTEYDDGADGKRANGVYKTYIDR